MTSKLDMLSDSWKHFVRAHIEMLQSGDFHDLDRLAQPYGTKQIDHDALTVTFRTPQDLSMFLLKWS